MNSIEFLMSYLPLFVIYFRFWLKVNWLSWLMAVVIFHFLITDTQKGNVFTKSSLGNLELGSPKAKLRAIERFTNKYLPKLSAQQKHSDFSVYLKTLPDLNLDDWLLYVRTEM